MPDTAASHLIIRADRLFDGLSTSTRADQAVIIDGDRIGAVGPMAQIQRQVPPDTEVIDLGDACITPGLIDSHTHVSLAADGRSYTELFAQTDELMVLWGVANLRRHLDAGITTLRDNGARNMVAFALKEGLRCGYIEGPRLLACGRSITCSEGHFHMCNAVADGEQEMQRAVRQLVHQGADFIKVMASGGGTVGTIPGQASYSIEELRATVSEARQLGRPTAAHCRARESMERAVEAGIDMLEHAEFLDPDNQMRFDPALARTMAERGTWICPTLQARTGYPRMAALYRRVEAGTITAGEEQDLKRMEARSEKPLDTVRGMLDCGLKGQIIPGTDCGVGNLEFGHLDYDMALLVRAGFTLGEALLAATKVSAEAIGMGDQIGSIEAGKVADLAAFAGDPTTNLAALSQTVAVFQQGQRVR